MKRKIQEVKKNVYRWSYELEDVEVLILCLFIFLAAEILTKIYG